MVGLVAVAVMKDGSGAGEPAPSRGDVYADYVQCYLEERAEVGPCRDPQLLKKAAQYLLSEAEIGGTFTMFPFYQAVTERCEAQSDFRKHLSAFIRAAEVLETLCVNLFLQPWKKEIRTLKVRGRAAAPYRSALDTRLTCYTVAADVTQLNHSVSQHLLV